MVVARYIFDAGAAELRAAGDVSTHRIWVGVEIASPIPIDLQVFSRVFGHDLIPADTLTDEELASVGIERFEPVILDGRV